MRLILKNLQYIMYGNICADFGSEQIKVDFTYNEDTSLGLKIQGQRPLPNGRWSQFTEVFRVPETCDASKITSQFGREVLTVVMPKLIVPKPEDQQIAEPPEKTQERKSPSPQASTSERPPSPKTTTERLTPSSTDSSSSESSSGSESPLQSPRKGEKKLTETVTAHTATSDETTRKGEVKSTSLEAAVVGKLGEDKPLVEEKSQKARHNGSSSAGTTLVDEKKEKKGVDHDQSEKSMPEKNKVEEVKGIMQDKELAAGSEEKEKGEDDDKKSGKKGENGVEQMNKREEEKKNDKKGVAEIEERKLLVNMGTALLVLAALAAFISSRLLHLENPEN